MTNGDPHEQMAPGYKVSIEGSELGTGLTELVGQLEYESVDGIADEGRLTIANPDLILSDSPMWLPGNEMDIWFGYGVELKQIGRVQIVRPEADFPRDTTPSITIKGYTKDQLMMQNTPEKAEASIRDFETSLISDAVERVASRKAYSIDFLDIDETPNRFASAQKADMSDYQFIKGLANVVGYLFWVDYEHEEEGWTLHFKDPETLQLQDRKYTFQYNAGDRSTLLDFRPEESLSGAVTKLQVQSRDPETGKTFVGEFEDDEEAPDSKYQGDPSKVVDETQTTAGAVVKLFWGDYALEVVADKKFKTEADLKWWAQQYFRRRRENFIIGRGTAIGANDVFARQSHNLDGLAKHLNGGYYFARVRHVFTPTDGYLMDFTARKEF